jgi:hypothetical protein
MWANNPLAYPKKLLYDADADRDEQPAADPLPALAAGRTQY